MDKNYLVEAIRKVNDIRFSIDPHTYEEGYFRVNNVLDTDYLSADELQKCEKVRQIKKEMSQGVASLIKNDEVKSVYWSQILPYISPIDPEESPWPSAYLEANAYLAFTYAKLYIALDAAQTSKTEKEMFEKASETYRQISGKALEKGLISGLAMNIAIKDGAKIEREHPKGSTDGEGK